MKASTVKPFWIFDTSTPFNIVLDFDSKQFKYEGRWSAFCGRSGGEACWIYVWNFDALYSFDKIYNDTDVVQTWPTSIMWQSKSIYRWRQWASTWGLDLDYKLDIDRSLSYIWWTHQILLFAFPCIYLECIDVQ